MKVTKFAIDHSMSVYVLIVCIVIGGLLSYKMLPREAAPDIPIPVVIVSTPYFGVSPSDIETLVTNPLEKEFKGLRGLKRMNSTSAESVSLVTLEFDPDINIEDALQRVRAQVDKAKRDIPTDAEDSEIIEINTSEFPILIANIAGDMDPLRLKQLSEDLQDDLENINGVLRVNMAGGVEREIQILVDPEKIRHHGVSLNEVIGAIQTENINLPGGSVDIGSMKYIVRVAGEFENVETIRNLVVKSPEGQPLYVRDVAEVQDSFKEASTYSRLTTWIEREDGTRTMETRPNISLAIIKRSGENIITIAEEAKELIAQYNERAGNDISITIVNDMSITIESQVNELENNIISGLILVLGVLFFFMGGARNALFVAVSVPLAMLITFLVLSMMGITLNMVVLFALILALGMLVDNAIVIVENIYRHASEGKSRVQAAIDGTTEVGWAVIASTATTVAAFFPMLFWPGVTGKFMGFLPLTVIITLLSSLFVALVINPTLCARFLQVKKGVTFSESAVPDIFIYRIYRATLVWSLNHRFLVLFLAFAAFICTMVIFGKTNRGVEFFPQTTPENFTISLQMPDGTNLDATDEILKELETVLDIAPDLVTAWITDAGIQGGGQVGGGGEAPHYGQISVELKEVEHQTSDPLAYMAKLRKAFEKIPGATIVLNRQNMGPPAGAPVNIELVGEDLQILGHLAQQVRQRVREIEGVIDLRDDVELSRPEIHVVVDRQRAALADLSTQSIAQTVRTAINGTQASVFREGDDEFDISVRLQEQSRRNIEDINSLTITNKDGFHIPITEVARVEVRGGSGSIRHINQDRVVTISANAADGYLPQQLMLQAEELLSDLALPAGYSIRFTGESEDQEEAAGFLAMALLAALFLIALILVTEFNSILQPIIILCSVLLSLIGVLWSLILTGEAFGIIMTGIGIISLAGVVVNNAIVLIDYTNKLLKKGLSQRDAILQAGLVRFRPVMLTAITTILGMLPLVIGISIDFVNQRIMIGGNSAEMWGQMARVVSGGLLVATMLTLIVVPVMLSVFGSLSNRTQLMLSRFSATSTVAILFIAIVLPSQLNAQETGLPQNVLPQAIETERTLTLEEARGRVRSQNYSVQMAQTQIDQAEGLIRQAWSLLHPRLSASGSYTINDEEVSIALGPPGMPEAVVQPRTDYRWAANATLSFNFRAYPLLQQAFAQRDLSKLQVEAVQDNLDFAVLQLYYSLLTIKRVIELSNQQVVSGQTMLRATQARFDAGVADQFELTRAELRLLQQEKNRERAYLQFIQVRESLAEMLQVPADFDVIAPATPQLPGDTQSLQQSALQQRTELAVQAMGEVVAQKSLDEVFWQYMPTISSTFSYYGSKGTLLNPGDPRWMLIFNAEWVLWDGGLRAGDRDQRQAQLLAAQLQRRQTELQITSEISRAHAEYLSILSQVESGQTEVELAQRGLNQAEIAFRHGIATQLDVINAQELLELAQISLVQDQLQLELAIHRLIHLSGH